MIYVINSRQTCRVVKDERNDSLASMTVHGMRESEMILRHQERFSECVLAGKIGHRVWGYISNREGNQVFDRCVNYRI